MERLSSLLTNLSTLLHHQSRSRSYPVEHAAKIACPTLIIEADHDFAGGGGTQLVTAMRPNRATLVRLTAASGGEGHCAGLGQDLWAQTVYGWLAPRFSARSLSVV